MFDQLAGMSPWWWVAIGLALGALEMATMSFFLIWPAIAAVLSAGLLYLSPQMSGEAQIAVFAILAVFLTFAGRYLIRRFGDGGETTNTLNSRSTLMIGRHAKVAEFVGPEGRVVIDGVRWHAKWQQDATAQTGETVEIMGADGMTLLVK